MKKTMLYIMLMGIFCLLGACTGKQAYSGQWLDRENAVKWEKHNGIFEITDIYSDCFFATSRSMQTYTAKFNGELKSFWCAGDLVFVTYENAWYDEKGNKMEADIIRVDSGNPIAGPSYAAKPVIYLYPEKETEVSVKLGIDGILTCTYPAYKDGWQVLAKPDGTLVDDNGQTYNYLYWEGLTDTDWDLSRGFCVKGEDTAAFLEQALAKLGLNRKEANEFIVYWLPLMQENPYNIIAFQTDVYAQAAKLQVSPTPDTVIRVFMAWQASDVLAELPAQKLTAPERTGFTVIEWGGTEVK